VNWRGGVKRNLGEEEGECEKEEEDGEGDAADLGFESRHRRAKF